VLCFHHNEHGVTLKAIAMQSDNQHGCIVPAWYLQAAVTAGGAGASPFKTLKSLQLCSTITVRGAFSSDVRFGLQVRSEQGDKAF
jgi:hypothetical protein